MSQRGGKMNGGRTRNNNGQLRRKRCDTHVGTIESKYRVNLGGRSDKHLRTMLKERRASSLSELLDHLSSPFRRNT